MEAKTTTKNSEVFAKDQTILLPLTARSDKSPMERITAETVLGWLRQGVTYQDIIRQGVELVFVDGITDGGAPMHQATIYKIKDTEIQLCFPRYDTMNCTADMIDEKAELFFRIIRDAHPDVPVVFVQNAVLHGTDIFDKGAERIVKAKNDAQLRLYEKLKKAGEKKIYFVYGDGMLGNDGEATVDGTHFTDLGMKRYAEHIYPTIVKALAGKK